MAAWTPPALRLLDRMRLQDQVTQAKRAISDAQKQLADARKAAAAAATALQAAQTAGPAAGEDDAAFQARLAQLKTNMQQQQQTVVAAEQTLGDARRARRELNLQLEADQEQKAHDARVARQREQLAQQLLALQADLAKHPQEWRKVSEQIREVLASYQVPMFAAGQKFASRFADGLRSGIAAVAAAAHQLAAALDKYVPHSPAQLGPLSKYDAFDVGAKFGDSFAAGVSSGLYTGQGMATPTVTPTVAAASAAAPTVTVTVNGWVGNNTELAYKIRDELLKIGRREPNVGLA
jgi:hypothetical protein